MLNLIVLLLAISKGLIGWSQLSDVKLKWKYEKQFGQQIQVPVFGEKLRALEGKAFVVSGYYIPAELDKNSIILSKLPYASCFFCGGAGIDSVIEIQFAKKLRRFKLDEIVKVSGTLHLNDSDYDHMIFILTNAKEVE